MLCPNCGKPFPPQGIYCVYCGASADKILNALTRAPKVNENMSSKAQLEFQKKRAEFNAAGKNATEVIEAILFAQSVELLLLKAPATACFSPLKETEVATKDNIYIVNGWVDSQNSYGAMIRTPFKISVTKINGEWKTISKIIPTSTAVGAKLAGNLIIGTVIATILTLISYFIIKSVI